MVHRDIKPENILLSKKRSRENRRLWIGETSESGYVDDKLTATRQVMGTIRYMAPEQFEGMGSVDHRADIYSLGVVFYELLTGEVPHGRFAHLPSEKM